MKNVYVRFENGVEDRIGDDLGPFEWAQITYSGLRIDQDGDWLALQDKDGYWYLVDRPWELWSDIIIYCR